MSKRFYIVVFVMLGFFMIPGVAFACVTKTEKACCKKESSVEKSKKECCKKAQSSKDKSHEGCDGACKNSICSSSTVYLGMTSFCNTESNNQSFTFSNKKQDYYYSEIFVSSDFRSIWLPPKIS